jgi:hypothetical protein
MAFDSPIFEKKVRDACSASMRKQLLYKLSLANMVVNNITLKRRYYP